MMGAVELDSTVAPNDNVGMNKCFSFPQYPISHEMEDESVALLLSTRPSNWLVRTPPGRDIGADGEIEIHDDRNFTGRLFKYQLKSTHEIEWDQDDGLGQSHRIKVSTANYWLGLGIPVFLFEADLSNRVIYFQAVGPQLRQKFGEMQNQKTIGLRLNRAQRIDSQQGLQIFERLYTYEHNLPKLMGLAEQFLFGLRATAQFLEEKQGRDMFMEVDLDVQERLRTVYKVYADLSDLLGYGKVMSYDDTVRKLENELGEACGQMREYTVTVLCREIEQKLPLFAKDLLRQIKSEEYQYWIKQNPELIRSCDLLSPFIEHLTKRVQFTPLGPRWREFGTYDKLPQ